MFKIIQQTIRTGIVTASYPAKPAEVSPFFRGKPVFDFERWQDARPAAEVCPTGAITFQDAGDQRTVTIDYGRCVFCGLCADVESGNAESGNAVRITREFELATLDRRKLILTASYQLNPDGTHVRLLACSAEDAVEKTGRTLQAAIQKVLRRSLSIRQVDAGSCNGCELEIVGLNNPIYDIERFGIHFVASPRHADMLLVTGPVTRNMELALLKTFRATPDPKIVVAVGACGISGGIFGESYASLGGVGKVLPVDVYIPGCPPRPQALLHGILLAVGRLAEK
jgi:Ni,Fe-hydrogenase III small subunit/formate hydrogenlyase subunit 6/NADH:ubiquinone oxidoreductase subunit I